MASDSNDTHSKDNDDIKQHLLKIEERLDRLSLSPQLNFSSLSAHKSDEIDLREIWGILWKQWRLIASIIFLFSVGGFCLAIYLPNIYQSKTLLAPSEEMRSGVSRVAGGLGGLASLAGINLSAGGAGNKVSVAMEVLKSREFISEFIDRHRLLPEIMAAKSWDPATRKLTFDSKLYDEKSRVWVRDAPSYKSRTPTHWEAYREFMSNLSVSQDKETGFVTVTFQHLSPVLSKNLVDNLVKDLNSTMKEKDVKEAKKSIEFLERQLSATALAEMRTVFYQLIEEQTKIIMLAEVRDEYVLSTIDPPVIPEEKFKPKKLLICIVSVLLGGLIALLFVMARYILLRAFK